MENQKIVIDFETYFDRKAKYDLKNISMVEYVRDPRFKVHGFGYVWVTDEPDPMGNPFSKFIPNWISGRDAEKWLKQQDWSKITVIAHNAKFDGFILTEHYKVKPKAWIDTKGMSRAILGKQIKDHSLATIAEHFGLVPKGSMKTDGLKDLTEAEEKELAEYCLHDVELCSEIYDRLAKEFPESQYEPLDWTIKAFVEPKLILNVSILKDAAEEEKRKKRAIFEELKIDKSIFSSNKKFSELLVKEGYRVPMKASPRTGEKIPALALGDPEFLDMLEDEDERLRTLCEARVAAKSTLLETRSEKLAQIGSTGPWSFDVEFSGASQTHRFSGGNGAGGNPQNFTRGSALRKAVCAPEGFKLVVGDFSNIELRLIAYLSKDQGLIQALEQDVDLYCDFASSFYSRKITKEDKLERQFGKTAILGLGYGMGPTKFKKTVRIQTGQIITDEAAKKAVNLYRTKYMQVPKFWKIHQDNLDTINYEKILLPSGLKIQYPNLRPDGDEWIYDVWKTKSNKETVKIYGGKIVENLCQALAGELCKEDIREFREVAVGQVHDEMILCVPEEEAAETAIALQFAMETPPSWLPKMKMKAEVGIGKNWLEAK